MKRHVFYIPGFDPRGARFYFQLYRQEAKKFAESSGTEIRVEREREDKNSESKPDALQIRWKGQGGDAATTYEFMGWDEVIKDFWEPSIVRLFVGAGKMYWQLWNEGTLGRVLRHSADAFMSCVFSAVYWIVMSLVCLLSGLLAFWMSGSFVPVWASIIVGFIFFVSGFVGAERMARQLGLPWLMRTCVLLFRIAREGLPEKLETKMQAMAHRIAKTLQNKELDEILLVGHSIGSILAVGTLARLNELVGELPPNFRFVTLGQCLPYVSLQPGGNFLRADLEALAGWKSLVWLDGTIRVDPLCFFMVDPFRAVYREEATGVGEKAGRKTTPNRGSREPESRVPLCHFRQFKIPLFRLFNKRNYLKIRFNFLRIHFQYLMHSDYPGIYNYFRFTAGPQPLDESNFVQGGNLQKTRTKSQNDR